MALDLGIPINSSKRIESGIKYSIILASYNGNTCVAKENLKKFVQEMLAVDIDDLEDSFINLKATKQITIEEQNDEEWIYLNPFYQTEFNVANKIKTMLNTKNTKYIKNFKTELKKQEKSLDIELSEKQKEAINAVNENNVCIITGGPRNTEKQQ